MRNIFFRTLIVLFFFLFSQCSKPPVQPKVYVAGIEFFNYSTDSAYSIAKLWVDGVPTDLTSTKDGAEAKCVTVSGGNVYVAGTISYRDKPSQAVLWKNKVPIYLPGNSTEAFSVSVSGNDVYVSGTAYINNVFHGVIWKNGAMSYLTNGYEYYGNVFALNKDVYATGYYKDQGGTQHAVIFKNGQPMPQSGNVVPSSFSSVFVSGQNVYATATRLNPYASLVYVNGVCTVLEQANTYTNAVYVNNKNVYVTGLAKPYQVALWKNNVIMPMESSNGGQGFSVFATNKDVYVAGIGEDGVYVPGGVPVLWKNGVKKVLLTKSNSGGFATSVFVY